MQNAIGLGGIALIGALATWLSVVVGQDILGFEKSPLSAVLIAVVLGIVVGNTTKFSKHYKNAIDFGVKKVLKIGVACLGLGISFVQVIAIAKISIPIVIATITLGLVLAIAFKRLFKISYNLSVLIGVGTSICGVTAIVATSPVIKAKEEETTYAVSAIALFGTLALVLYPNLVNFVFSSTDQIGVFLGSSIHDTSQAVGAGLIYAQAHEASEVLDIATITKLLRNSFLILIIPLVAYLTYKQGQQGQLSSFNFKTAIPFFIVAFMILAIVRTLGDLTLEATSILPLWENLIMGVMFFAKSICLVFAMTAVGLSTDLSKFSNLGLKPLMAGFLMALLIGASNALLLKVML